MSDVKKCCTCGEIKPLDKFHKDVKGKFGRRGTCKLCHTKKHDRGEKKRNKNLRFRYGISVEQWENMFDAQGRKCKICEKHEDTGYKHFVVDHCHTTGAIRGILCNKCNTGLGRFKDCPDELRKAMEYLLQTKELDEE